MYDYTIIGAGLFGATFARRALDSGKSVLVIEQRDHIAGNCYTENINGIHVHKYGPHIFHCSSEKIWNFVNRFAKFNHFVNRPRVDFGGKIFSFPINMMTLHQLWGVTSPAEAEKKLLEVREKNDSPRNFEEWVLSQVGRQIYETFFYGYTKKQWGRDPKDLPASIAKRIPIRLTWDDNYFNDTYQGIPIGGYTQMFEKMFEGSEIQTGIDFFDERNLLERISRKIVYTGKIDRFFEFKYGDLEYRSLDFKTEMCNIVNYQGVAQMNHTSADVAFTRTTEHRHFEFNLKEDVNSIITREYPIAWDRSQIPYYPVNDEKNNKLYEAYQGLKDDISADKKYIFGGRLASFKYYDMHQVIGEALAKYEQERNK